MPRLHGVRGRARLLARSSGSNRRGARRERVQDRRHLAGEIARENRSEILVRTEGNEEPIPLHLASQGTLNVLAIFLQRFSTTWRRCIRAFRVTQRSSPASERSSSSTRSTRTCTRRAASHRARASRGLPETSSSSCLRTARSSSRAAGAMKSRTLVRREGLASRFASSTRISSVESRPRSCAGCKTSRLSTCDYLTARSDAARRVRTRGQSARRSKRARVR